MSLSVGATNGSDTYGNSATITASLLTSTRNGKLSATAFPLFNRLSSTRQVRSVEPETNRRHRIQKSLTSWFIIGYTVPIMAVDLPRTSTIARPLGGDSRTAVDSISTPPEPPGHRFAVLAGRQAVTSAVAAEIENLGYGALWLGQLSGADLALVEPLLAATRSMTVGTAILNIHTAPAENVAAAYHRIEQRFPGRLVLGLGTGHREFCTPQLRPYSSLSAYLDRLDAAGIPRRRRALAALGPRMLNLARDRTAGSLPYFVPPQHTRMARAILGSDAMLAVGQVVVAHDDPALARLLTLPTMSLYLRLSNYTRNLRRLGYHEDELNGFGSHRLVDELTAHGDFDVVADRLRRHLHAGASQVAVCVASADTDLLPTVRGLAPRLGL